MARPPRAGRIDRLGLAHAQRVAPDRQHQQRREQDAHRVVEVVVRNAELAALHAARDGGGEHRLAALHDLLEVELRDLGEVAGLAHHQLDHAGIVRGAHRLPPAMRDGAQQLGGAHVGVSQQRLAFVDEGHQALLYYRLEQRLLVVVVQVQRALGDAGARRDILEARRRVALLDEQGERRGEQFHGARFLASLPARFGFFRSFHARPDLCN